MAVQVRRFTKGDLIRGPSAQLKNPDGTPVDLTGVSALDFLMVPEGSTSPKVNYKAAVVDTPLQGLVHYEPDSNDWNTSGTFWGYFRRTVSGKTEHFPAGKEFQIIIEDPFSV